MNATHRLNVLLSDILQPDSPNLSTDRSISSQSSRSIVPSLTFAEHDRHSSSMLPSNNTVSPSVSSRRNSSGLQHCSVSRPNAEKQSVTALPPLLNSATLDDLFRALTLECEQYLATAKTITSSQKNIYTPKIVPAMLTNKTTIESNDEDYENLQKPIANIQPGRFSSLRTRIEVISPEKKQIVSTRISTKTIVPPSQTFPMLSESSSLAGKSSLNQPYVCHSSDDDDTLDVSSSYSTRRRRRRIIRKQAPMMQPVESSSSDDERKESIYDMSNDKKLGSSKRSNSHVDHHRASRMKNIVDSRSIPSSNSSLSQGKYCYRRDISLPHTDEWSRMANIRSTKFSPFPAQLYSPLSVLLTSTRNKNDLVDRNDRSQRSRHQLFDRLQTIPRQQYPTDRQHNVNNIPTNRIPSFPVY